MVQLQNVILQNTYWSVVLIIKLSGKTKRPTLSNLLLSLKTQTVTLAYIFRCMAGKISERLLGPYMTYLPPC